MCLANVGQDGCARFGAPATGSCSRQDCVFVVVGVWIACGSDVRPAVEILTLWKPDGVWRMHCGQQLLLTTPQLHQFVHPVRKHGAAASKLVNLLAGEHENVILPVEQSGTERSVSNRQSNSTAACVEQRLFEPRPLAVCDSALGPSNKEPHGRGFCWRATTNLPEQS
jgi:hypothetical protein